MQKHRFGRLMLTLGLILGIGLTCAGCGKTASTTTVASGKFLGNIIASYVPSNFATYWNQVTPENGAKWGTVENTRDTMSWTQADTAYNYAKNNGFPFKFHTLVWGSQQPSWIDNLSASKQQDEVKEWFAAVAERYAGIDFIDVVNEPLHSVPSYKDAINETNTTWGWVIWAFETARQYFPNSKLLINDYGIISDPDAAAEYVTIINLLKEKDLIDGIGIQCHCFNMNTVSTSTMKNVLDTLAATGLPLYVSELDMTGADDATQKTLYEEKFPILFEHSAVKGVTLWGWIEGETWKADTHLITASGTERSALTWLKEYYQAYLAN